MVSIAVLTNGVCDFFFSFLLWLVLLVGLFVFFSSSSVSVSLLLSVVGILF